MGHDTFAYSSGDQIAYLRRNVISDDKNIIYQLLNVEEYNVGVSGNGELKRFSHEDIDNAFKKGIENKVSEDILYFLLACLEENSDVIVEFL